jgi:hypothetical protein
VSADMHEWQTIHSAKIYRELYIGNEICAVIPQTAITAGGGVPEITSQYISHPMNLILRPDDRMSARNLSYRASRGRVDSSKCSNLWATSKLKRHDHNEQKQSFYSPQKLHCMHAYKRSMLSYPDLHLHIHSHTLSPFSYSHPHPMKKMVYPSPPFPPHSPPQPQSKKQQHPSGMKHHLPQN